MLFLCKEDGGGGGKIMNLPDWYDGFYSILIERERHRAFIFSSQSVNQSRRSYGRSSLQNPSVHRHRSGAGGSKQLLSSRNLRIMLGPEAFSCELGQEKAIFGMRLRLGP